MNGIIFMGETRNERNFRLLEKRFEIEDEMESLIEKYGTRFIVDDGNENEVKLYVLNGNEPVRVFENEHLSLIRNESSSQLGIGFGNELENEPHKRFENEVWFENGNEIRFGNELGLGNGNGFENENENRNGNGNGNGNGNELPSKNKQKPKNELYFTSNILNRLKRWFP